jgi:hypothetical protein
MVRKRCHNVLILLNYLLNYEVVCLLQVALNQSELSTSDRWRSYSKACGAVTGIESKWDSLKLCSDAREWRCTFGRRRSARSSELKPSRRTRTSPQNCKPCDSSLEGRSRSI